MHQPGLDLGLAKIQYAEVLEEAANERADRKARVAAPKSSVRPLALTLAAAAPIALWITWMLVAR